MNGQFGLRALRVFAVLLLVGLANQACTVHQTEAPSLTGPSTFALAVEVTALPDTITRDGGAQSAITIHAHNASGQPVAGQTFRLEIQVDGSTASLGSLSGTTVVTGSDGIARATYTAPVASPPGTTTPTCHGVVGQCVSVVATPLGTDTAASVTQSVQIRLVPLGVILPPSAAPVAKFVFVPSAPTVGAPVLFDASTSCPAALDVSGVCLGPGTITSYQWNFGDGSTGTGVNPSHSFTSQGSFNVILTVTNDSALSGTVTLPVSVGAGAAPTGSFTVSPSAPNVGDTVQFSAETVTPAPGRTIVQFSWNFGDPTSATNSASGFQVTHKYSVVGTYTVLLEVRDDAGQGASFTQTVTIGSGAPFASFTSASSPPPPHNMTFDASASRAQGSATIASYNWNFGDGLFGSGGPTITHPYTLAGTYTVTLTVTDNATPARSSTVSQSVTVP